MDGWIYVFTYLFMNFEWNKNGEIYFVRVSSKVMLCD